jgi:hypothetical protein
LARFTQHFEREINELTDNAKFAAQSNFGPEAASLRHRSAADGENLN